MDLINKIFNLTRFAVLKTPQQDKTTNQKVFYNAQIASYGGVNQAHIIYPYGVYGVAPQNAQCVALDIAGQAENKVAFAFDIATQFYGLKPYEFQCGNQQVKSYINFLNDGSINITTPKGNLVIKLPSGDVVMNVTGNLTATVSGNVNINAQGTLLAKSTGNATIESDAQVQLKAGSGTLTLTPSGLVSSVTITAPGLAMSGGGNITGIGDMTTQAGKSFNAHTHSPGSFEAGGDPVTGTSGALT